MLCEAIDYFTPIELFDFVLALLSIESIFLSFLAVIKFSRNRYFIYLGALSLSFIINLALFNAHESGLLIGQSNKA